MAEQAQKRRLRLPPQSQIFFYLLLALMLFLTWLVFRPFVIFMITGVFVAVLALPIDRVWERAFRAGKPVSPRKRKRRDRLAAAMTILTLFLIITVPLVLLGFAIANDARAAVDAVQQGTFRDTIDRVLDIFLPNQTAAERQATVDRIWNETQPRLVGAFNALLADLANFVLDFFVALTVILFVVYYILVDGRTLVVYLRRAAPLPAAQVDFLLKEARRGLDAVFVGQILTSAIQGALGGVGFIIAGVPGAVLWAAVMAILSLLPVVGAFLVWIPAVFYLLLVEKVWQAIFLAAWGVLVVSQVDNFVRPKLIGSRAQIHPIFVLIGVLGGVAAFGFIGLFLGPLLVGVTISVLRVWESDYLDPDLGEDPDNPRTIYEIGDGPPQAEDVGASGPPEEPSSHDR